MPGQRSNLYPGAAEMLEISPCATVVTLDPEFRFWILSSWLWILDLVMGRRGGWGWFEIQILDSEIWFWILGFGFRALNSGS